MYQRNTDDGDGYTEGGSCSVVTGPFILYGVASPASSRCCPKRDAASCFTLPDGSVRSANAAFVSNERLAELTTVGKHGFAPVVQNYVM